MVEINHGNGYQTRYAHHKKNLVVVGQKVDKGQVIALMGDSGRATGPHVHFEVVKNGTPINPIKYTSSK
jgi:murein DD-endopeptidase MepM/ murein hydrolase activator NlpD